MRHWAVSGFLLPPAHNEQIILPVRIQDHLGLNRERPDYTHGCKLLYPLEHNDIQSLPPRCNRTGQATDSGANNHNLERLSHDLANGELFEMRTSNLSNGYLKSQTLELGSADSPVAGLVIGSIPSVIFQGSWVHDPAYVGSTNPVVPANTCNPSLFLVVVHSLGSFLVHSPAGHGSKKYIRSLELEAYLVP